MPKRLTHYTWSCDARGCGSQSMPLIVANKPKGWVEHREILSFGKSGLYVFCSTEHLYAWTMGWSVVDVVDDDDES